MRNLIKKKNIYFIFLQFLLCSFGGFAFTPKLASATAPSNCSNPSSCNMCGGSGCAAQAAYCSCYATQRFGSSTSSAAQSYIASCMSSTGCSSNTSPANVQQCVQTVTDSCGHVTNTTVASSYCTAITCSGNAGPPATQGVWSDSGTACCGGGTTATNGACPTLTSTCSNTCGSGYTQAAYPGCGCTPTVAACNNGVPVPNVCNSDDDCSGCCAGFNGNGVGNCSGAGGTCHCNLNLNLN